VEFLMTQSSLRWKGANRILKKMFKDSVGSKQRERNMEIKVNER